MPNYCLTLIYIPNITGEPNVSLNYNIYRFSLSFPHFGEKMYTYFNGMEK